MTTHRITWSPNVEPETRARLQAEIDKIQNAKRVSHTPSKPRMPERTWGQVREVTNRFAPDRGARWMGPQCAYVPAPVDQWLADQIAKQRNQKEIA